MILSVSGLILSSSVWAEVFRVPSEYPTIQEGVDAAWIGDTVMVADGTYTGDGNRDIDFKAKAITVSSENGPERCMIDCQGSAQEKHRGFYFHNREPNNAIVKGFTIQNGFYENGGGIYCKSSSPTISDCVFTDNTATSEGGGICLFDSRNSSISNCMFSENKAMDWGNLEGGGICLNFAYNTTISNCTLTGNTTEYGGGICADYCSGTTISNCTVTQNRSEFGGGIYLYTSKNSTIFNCTFTENHAKFGGGMDIHSSENLIISNCTFSGNIANYHGSGGIDVKYCSSKLSNCILWNDTPDEISYMESIPTTSYCIIQGGYPGIGIFDTDPLFLGGNPFDYHLAPDSPAIDAGTDNNAPAQDLDDTPRPQGGGVDMGAYEYHGWPSLSRTCVKMPAHMFIAGDPASCSVSVRNAGTSTLSGYPLFTILDVYGSYYFAPGFCDFDYFKWSFPPGLTELTVLPEFTWPENVGSATGIVWYAALVNPEMTELASEMGVFDFGWSE